MYKEALRKVALESGVIIPCFLVGISPSTKCARRIVQVGDAGLLLPAVEGCVSADPSRDADATGSSPRPLRLRALSPIRRLVGMRPSDRYEPARMLRWRLPAFRDSLPKHLGADAARRCIGRTFPMLRAIAARLPLFCAGVPKAKSPNAAVDASSHSRWFGARPARLSATSDRNRDRLAPSCTQKGRSKWPEEIPPRLVHQLRGRRMGAAPVGGRRQAVGRRVLRRVRPHAVERACFDYIMLEDTLMVAGGLWRQHPQGGWRTRSRVPKHDPVPMCAVMGAATSNVGVVATMSTLGYTPFLLARLSARVDPRDGGRSAGTL